MMKVGILTLHFGCNYGGVLQCLALQKVLTQMGVSAKVIDYHPSQKYQLLFTLSNLLGKRVRERVINVAAGRRFGREHHRKFAAFRQLNLNLTKHCGSIKALKQLANEFDAIIVGSDQVWNGEWRWPVYFLDFTDNYRGRRISYAACFGHSDQPTALMEQASVWLARFDSISVRNKLSAVLVQRLCGREAEIAADPTLLVDLGEFATRPSMAQSEFILVYSLNAGRIAESSAIVRAVKARLRLPVICVVPGSLKQWRFPAADRMVLDAGPAEWLWLFANASFICTDSFHGSIFAMKQRKPFIVFDHRSSGSQRLYDLTERFDMQSCLINETRQITEDKFWGASLDYNGVHSRMSVFADKSRGFLRRALELGE